MQLGSDTEIVLHDLTKPYESTIVEIANGELSGRKVGDSGTNLGLEVLRGKVHDGDRFNYITNGRDGRTFRSSSMYLYDDDHRPIGSICLNTDITETIKMEQYFHEKNQISLSEEESTGEIFANNVGDILNYLLVHAQQKIGKPVADMSREDKIEFLNYLDERGAFLISKANEKIGSYLGISKFTLYHYLDIARNENKEETT